MICDAASTESQRRILAARGTFSCLKEPNGLAIMLRLHKLKANVHRVKLVSIYGEPVSKVAAEHLQNGIHNQNVHVHEDNMLGGGIGL